MTTSPFYFHTVQTGSALQVQIWLTANTNADAADLGLTFNPSLGTFSGFTATTGWSAAVNSSVSGTIGVAMFDTGLGSNLVGATADSLLGTFNFVSAAGAKTFTAALVNTNNTPTDLSDANGNTIAVSTAFPLALNVGVVCYLRGTLILTSRGEVAVEDLQPGMMLATRFGGLRPLQWIGQQSFDGLFLGESHAPVLFKAGALGTNMPVRDLRVSPAHCMMLDDHLVPAHLLVNDVTITQNAVAGRVDYFHVDLGEHDCVLADGAWAESYACRANRAMFHNLEAFKVTFPEDSQMWQSLCLPLLDLEDGGVLASILARLAARIQPTAFTVESNVHLRADGERIDPSLVDGETMVFLVPARTVTLRLMSNAARPSALGESTDNRPLGFCICSITAQTAKTTVSLQADHADFNEGFYATEHDVQNLGKRWSNGDALLPAILLGNGESTVTLTVNGHGLSQYVAPDILRAA